MVAVMIPYIISNNSGTYVSQASFDMWKNQNGLGRLTQCLSCTVTEQLNGEKTAVLRVPMDALHAEKIARGGLLMFDDSEDALQLWRIDSITKSFADGIVEVNCNHISYDLNRLACRPFNSTGASNIMTSLQTRYVSYVPFKFISAVSNATANVSIQVPTYYRDIIGGMDGNILETLGCEVDWDNLNVRFVPHRGAVKDITIRYGANIIDARQEEAMADAVSYVYGYVKKGDDALVLGLPVGTSSDDYFRIAVVDLTNTFEDTDTINQQTVKEHTQTWCDENDVFTPKISFSIDYLSLADVDPDKWSWYKDLRIGDTVSVVLPQLGRYTARVQEIVYDVLQDRIDSVQIGNYKETLADTIYNIQKESASLRAYPVGSYYTTSVKTNPAAIFGGEWTLVSSSGSQFTFRRTK